MTPARRTRRPGEELRPLGEVREAVLSAVAPLDVEELALDECLGRVLAQDIEVREHVPPFDNSAMDGYAVRASDLHGASEKAPVRLELDGEVAAGDAPREEPLRPGTAVRIFTGAPLPAAADAVVQQEHTRVEDGLVVLTAPVTGGRNVRRAGGDMSPGDRPLRSGEVLGSAQLAIAATLGGARLRVHAAPVVGVVSTGDELVPVDEEPAPGRIRNSNAHYLRAAVRETGAVPLDLGIVEDRVEAVEGAVRTAIDRGAHAVVSSGGVSAGDRDAVRDFVRERCSPGRVHKVAMRPGKPFAFGLYAGRPVFGLPGNPASSVVSFEVLVRPALRRMRGEARVLPWTFGVRFPFEFRYKPGRTFLLRARVVPDPESTGSWVLEEPGAQDSSFLASLATANALVVLPPGEDRVEPGGMRPAVWLSSFRP